MLDDLVDTMLVVAVVFFFIFAVCAGLFDILTYVGAPSFVRWAIPSFLICIVLTALIYTLKKHLDKAR